MLTLDDKQWSELTVRDTNSFVEAVCDQYLSIRPKMILAPGRDELLRRMEDAHHYAIEIGFTSTPHIVRWMNLGADAPGIHKDKVVDTHLRRPGAKPEQRLDDLLAVVINELKELGGSD